MQTRARDVKIPLAQLTPFLPPSLHATIHFISSSTSAPLRSTVHSSYFNDIDYEASSTLCGIFSDSRWLLSLPRHLPSIPQSIHMASKKPSWLLSRRWTRSRSHLIKSNIRPRPRPGRWYKWRGAWDTICYSVCHCTTIALGKDPIIRDGETRYTQWFRSCLMR